MEALGEMDMNEYQIAYSSTLKAGIIQQDLSPIALDTLASTVDISTAILERAGLEPYHGIQGKSFLPTIQAGSEHRDEVMIEFNDNAAKFGFERPARVRSLITKHWRLSMYRDQDWGELYDLDNDPNEIHNLWDDVDYQLHKMQLTERLVHQLIHQMDESPPAMWLA